MDSSDYIDCTISSDINIPGFQDQKINLINVSALFRFGEMYGERFIGQTEVRGIQSQTWESQIETNSNGVRFSGSVQYSFSADNWNISTVQSQTQVPIEAYYVGDTYYPNGTRTLTELYYEYFFFSVGVSPGVFQLPSGIYCMGSTVDTPPLPTLPSQYQSVVEINLLQQNYTATIFEYYDTVNNRARIDILSEVTPVIYLDLPSENLHYQIVGETCTTRDPPSYVVSTGNGTFQIEPASQLFHFGEQYDEHFQGFKEVRGIPCEVWWSSVLQVTEDTIYDYDVLWYFSAPSWNSSGYSRIPIQAEYSGMIFTNGNSQTFDNLYEFVGFVPGAPSIDNFVLSDSWGCNLPTQVSVFALFQLDYQVAVTSDDFLNALSLVIGVPRVFIQLLAQLGDYRIVEIKASDEVLGERVQEILLQQPSLPNYNIAHYPVQSVTFTDSLSCPGSCNSNGECYFGKCLCNEGYSGSNCSTVTQAAKQNPKNNHSISTGAAIGVFFGGVVVGAGIPILFILITRRRHTFIIQQTLNKLAEEQQTQHS